MKVHFFKLIKTYRTISYSEDLYSLITTEGDFKEEGIAAFPTEKEALIAIINGKYAGKYKTELISYNNSKEYGVSEYIVAEYEVEKDVTVEEVVKLSTDNDFKPLDGEELVEYHASTPMEFLVTIKTQDQKILDYVLVDTLNKAKKFADDISLDNEDVYEYYNAEKNDIVASVEFYDEKNYLVKGVEIHDGVDSYKEKIKKPSKEFGFVKGKLLKDCIYGSDMFECEFEDKRQAEHISFYANLSNFDSPTIEEADVYVYAHSFDTLCNAEDYNITNNFSDRQLEYLKETIIKEYQKTITLNTL